MARRKDEQADGPETGDPRKLVRAIRTKLTKEDEERVTWDLSSEASPTDVKEFISTGSTLLDYCISNRPNGGVPAGKITEIQGEEASGKSLLAAHILANTQRKGGIAVLIDSENAAHPAFMKQIGVDLEQLVYIQPGTMEKAFEYLEQIILTSRAKAENRTCPITIVWDSIAATPPQAEIEGTYDPQSQIGLMAKLLARGLRKVTDLIGKQQITLVMTNQLKMKPGVMYGDPWITPGGKAVGYHSSVRIRLTSGKKLQNEDKDVYAVATTAKVIKSRLGPPFRSCRFEIHFDRGVDDVGSWFEELHGMGVIEKRNGWCYIPARLLRETFGNQADIVPAVDALVKGKDEFQFREGDFRKTFAQGLLREFCELIFAKAMVRTYGDPDTRVGTPIEGTEGEEPSDA